jgi:hypothetical protein
MAKIEHDIVAVLMAEIGSPLIVARIDQAIEATEQQRQELLELRKMAVRRHGEMPASEEDPPQQQTTPKEEHQSFSLNVADLVNRYHTDPQSGFHKLRFKTRVSYENLTRRVARELGDEKVGNLNEERLQRAYDEWSTGGRIPMARSLIAILRIMATYGTTVLKSRDCRELKLTLHDMKFKPGAKVRNERLTADQASAIIGKAHERKLHSIALAQAFQFGCGLKQKDVIGEWVPLTEPSESSVSDGEKKWLRGLLWSEIDENMVLRHATSLQGKVMELSLSDIPMVMKELGTADRSALPTSGPVVVSDLKGIPWTAVEFRRKWRQIADAAGVPKNVFNMDSDL